MKLIQAAKTGDIEEIKELLDAHPHDVSVLYEYHVSLKKYAHFDWPCDENVNLVLPSH